MKRSDKRKTNRWEGYNYSMPGWYFVTVCVRDFKCWLGKVEDNEMVLNEAGEIVKTRWLWLKDNFNYVDLDEFVIMPNHMHGILIIKNSINRNVGTILGLSPDL